MKKLLTVILAIALAAGSAISAAAAAVPTPNENGVEEKPDYEVIDNAWTILYRAVFGDNGVIIRDDYAGAWVDPEDQQYFYFALTPDADRAYYENLLAGRTDYEFVTLKYSLKTLLHMRDVVFDRCKDIMSGAGAREDENVIYFEVRVSEEEENGRIAAAMKAVKEEENLPDGIENAFEIAYGVRVMPVDENVQVPTEGKICKEE